MEDTIRLNKFLSDIGYCSRREADRLIEAGRITVDGMRAVTGMKISAGARVEADGRLVGTPEDAAKVKRVLLAVNKPVGVVCSTSDRDRAPIITELVDYPERIYPIGRLDKDSCGLILMTNDGSLVNRILKASNHHEKEYVVRVDQLITREFISQMRKGVRLEELHVTTRKCFVEQMDERTFRIILTQGLNRQIRRMCQALGYHVLSLQRIRIMNIELGRLKEGTFRKVKGEELESLLRGLDE